MRSRRTWRLVVTLAAVSMLAALAAPAGARLGDGAEVPGSGYYDDDVPDRNFRLQIIALNDFHGNINTESTSFGGVGGADFLAANIAAREKGRRNSTVVSAGDMIGASPLISALFHDEPTIEVMNLIGMDIAGVGNHEFDEGKRELRRMKRGGTHPVDGDFGGTVFEGSDFKWLSANVIVDKKAKPLFRPYKIKKYRGVKVAYIGLTLEGTPTIVTQAGVRGLTFLDEAETINAYVQWLQYFGVESFVILLHEGGSSDGGQNDCGTGLTGPIADITRNLDPAVDLVIAGHTNDEFVCYFPDNDIWVTMADNAGRLFTDIEVTLNSRTRDLTVKKIENIANLREGVTPDAQVRALIDFYDDLSAPLANQIIGTTPSDILRTANAAGESPLGDVIADAQLAATDSAGVGEAFSVQPFGNSLVTMTLTGAQIGTLLEQQFDNPGVGEMRVLQVSEGFTYEWSASAPTGSKVDAASIMLNGVALDPGTGYRVTVNSFLADGGDGFSVLVEGTDRLGGEVDLDALVTYFADNSPVAPGPQDRITMVP